MQLLNINIDFDHKNLTMADCWLFAPTPFCSLWSLFQGMFTYISNLSECKYKFIRYLKIKLGVKTIIIWLPRLKEAKAKKNAYTTTPTF